LIDKNESNYIVNGKVISIYGLMSIFKSFEPKNVTRYKGLGEMKPSLLGTSTVIPGYGRTLKQYTIEDAKALLNKITALQNDKSVFVKGIKIRKEDIV
jgi:DNA gyrase/topoisomerase IV subunit B